jgi:OFA family oxalate/formate antiporter-like MFS transporter
MILGIIFLVAVVLGAQFLRVPPAGWRPAGWNPPAAAGPAVKADYTWKEMLATPQFWLLWLTYFAGCTAGLMIIMNSSTIWQSFAARRAASGGQLETRLFEQIVTAGAVSVSTIAIFNAAGRIAWGKISDTLGSRTRTLIIMFAICAVAMGLLHWMTAYPLFIIVTGLIGLCFGGYLALYPAVTADFYGTKNHGVNYGFMFLAYGAGGIVGPLLQAQLVQKAGAIQIVAANAAAKNFDVIHYRTAFVVSAILCAAAVVVAATIRPPKHA